MVSHRPGETVQVIPALKHGYDPTFAMLVCQLAENLSERDKVGIRESKTAQGVIDSRVEAR